MIKYNYTWTEFFKDLDILKEKLKPNDILYAVPRGGFFVTNFLTQRKTIDIDKATVIIDDILDSGATRKKYETMTHADFLVLVDKQKDEHKNKGYIIFPWENNTLDDHDIVTRMIEAIGESPNREGLIDTPKRVVKSWKKIFGGYSQTAEEVLQTAFTEEYDQMIVCKDIEFYSTCEHHMLPFYGKAHIGYIPNEKVVGLSKMPRLLEVFARRMQIQERLTNQVADSMQRIIQPKGAGVIIEAKHHCMVCRGVEKQNSSMITTALTGVFKEQLVKDEFQGHCK